jgi:ribosomal protein L12E/L44/L45/RPP1/RPP2
VGARIVEVDYSNVDALAKAFEDNKIDTVINSLGVVHDPAPMFNLIEAADKSKTTSRFIPNFFSALLYQTE